MSRDFPWYWEQLQGFEAAAAAWEGFILPSRVRAYAPEILDRLCLSGKFSWARLSRPSALENSGISPEPPRSSRGIRPSRVAPVAFFKRLEMREYLRLGRPGHPENPQENPTQLNLSHPAGEVLQQLRHWGACFFEDLVRTTGRLPVEVEEGLWELVAAGLATADGFDNLRFLMDPRRRRGFRHRNSRRSPLNQMARSMGRWSLLDLPGESRGQEMNTELLLVARQLLVRWGVVFRDLLSREGLGVVWRDLLTVYRKMEAQGQVRGGRFVSGFVGEQFALPEAVDALRALRRSQSSGEVIRISAADPLNLTGIITPGPRIRSHPRNLLYYRDGVPVDEETFLISKSPSLPALQDSPTN